MSWGYFVDLNLTLPTTAWRRLEKLPLKDQPIPIGWWGFADKELEEAFCQPVNDSQRFDEVFAWYKSDKEAVRKVTTDGDRTTIRFCTLLDKSLLYNAKAFAALVDAARHESGDGSIALVNDGTYDGEDGVLVKVANGQLERELIVDCWTMVERLGTEIYGSELFADPGAPAAKKSAARKPATKKSPAKQPARKSAAKAPAAKRSAAKKPAKKPAKQPSAAKQRAAKQSAAKQPKRKRKR